MIKGCGKQLDKIELNDHKMRKMAKPDMLVRALCKAHQRQAVKDVKGMKWMSGQWVKKNEIVISKMALRRAQIGVDVPGPPEVLADPIAEEETEPPPEPLPQAAAAVIAEESGAGNDAAIKKMMNEIEASRKREERMMRMMEQQQQQLQQLQPVQKLSQDEIAYEAGRQAALLEASENLSAKAAPSFSFPKPMDRGEND